MTRGATATAAGAWLTLLLLSRAVAAAAPAATPGAALAQLLGLSLSPGAAAVSEGQQFLTALQNGTGDIQLLGPIYLTPDVRTAFQLPIVLPPGTTVLVHHADPSGLGVRQVVLDWGSAIGLIQLSSNATLALDGIIAQNPGNWTQGLTDAPLGLKVNGSYLWPTVTGYLNSSLILANCTVFNDDPTCSPQTSEAAALRFSGMFSDAGIKYLGGVSVYWQRLAFPTPVYNTSDRTVLGKASYQLLETTNTCFNSLEPGSFNSTSGGGSGGSAGGSSSGSSSSGSGTGGGTPAWVWAVVGSVSGCAALVAVGAALLWRRSKQRRTAEAAAAKAVDVSADLEGGSCHGLGSKTSSGKAGSGGGLTAAPSLEPPAAKGFSGGTLRSDSGRQASAGGSGVLGAGRAGSADLQAALLRARFGAIEDLQLGDLLGRGAFGRVYKGRWRGAIVAVKVIETRVMPGKTHDLSREPLLSMSISHPNVLATHQVVVVRLKESSEEGQGQSPDPLAASGGSSPGSSSSGAGGSGGSPLTSNLGRAGSGGFEVVSPHDVLLPGHYESWLVVEYADRGSLADLLSTGRHAPPDPAHAEAWTVLTLLDIATGLNYLHASSIVHGDLKPANVMLKSTRADRRGFTAKLGDFGLSRALVGEQTHVETQSYGTAAYAAPELLTSGKLSSASDVYSFALIIWELTSGGAELHAGFNSMQIILQVSQYGYRPEVPASCPPALAGLMQRCWSGEPSQRPTSAQIVEELRAMMVALRPSLPTPQPSTPLTPRRPPLPQGSL